MRVARQGFRRQPDKAHEFARTLGGLRVVQAEIHRSFNDGSADGPAWVERAKRVLKHDLHVPAVRTQPAFGELRHIGVADAN